MPAPHHAARREAPTWIPATIGALPPELRTNPLQQIRVVRGHSNDICELTLADGRVLLLKRARHEWVRPQFLASAMAAQRIRAASDIVVPQPLPFDHTPEGMPVQAYWRIQLPTLAHLWPTLSAPARARALRSLGALTRRLHTIEAPSWGPLAAAEPAADPSTALHRDLHGRLLPAVIAHWPDGIASLETLIAAIPLVQPPRTSMRAALVHSDLHLGNVLCRARGSTVECVGFLDLDGAAGGVPESDVACFDVLHGPRFQWHIDPDMRAALRHGYAMPLNQRRIDFHTCAHLVNQGFSSALLGHDEHAAAVATELRRRIRLFPARTRRRATPRTCGHAAAARY